VFLRELRSKRTFLFSANILGPNRQTPPNPSQIRNTHESGFGGWVDEKSQTAREAVPLLGREKIHPQHLTMAQSCVTDKGDCGKSSLFQQPGCP